MYLIIAYNENPLCPSKNRVDFHKTNISPKSFIIIVSITIITIKVTDDTLDILRENDVEPETNRVKNHSG